MNKAIADGRISAPIILGRDHHDVSGTDSPYRETANIHDGSKWTADMSVQNFVGDAMREQRGSVCIMEVASVGARYPMVVLVCSLMGQKMLNNDFNLCCTGMYPMASLVEPGPVMKALSNP